MSRVRAIVDQAKARTRRGQFVFPPSHPGDLVGIAGVWCLGGLRQGPRLLPWSGSGPLRVSKKDQALNLTTSF